MALQIGGAVQMDYAPGGLVCTITAPQDRLRADLADQAAARTGDQGPDQGAETGRDGGPAALA